MKNYIKKLSAVILSAALALTMLSFGAAADSTVYCAIAAPAEDLAIGRETELLLSVNGILPESDAVRGVQIDIGGFDSDVVEFISCRSLVNDDTAETNEGSYHEESGKARFLYVNFNGTLAVNDSGHKNVCALKLAIRRGITESGSVTLPVTMKVQTLNGQFTHETSVPLYYATTGTGGKGVIGDANMDGKVNPLDVAYFERYLAGWSEYDDVNVDISVLDLDSDGSVNPKDAAILARHIASWVGYETLPITVN